jgi:hypothetical protein
VPSLAQTCRPPFHAFVLMTKGQFLAPVFLFGKETSIVAFPSFHCFQLRHLASPLHKSKLEVSNSLVSQK